MRPSERRKDAARLAGLNGLDWLEVSHPAQTTLTVRLLADGAGLDGTNFRIEGGVRVTGVRVTNAVVSGEEVTLTVDRRGDFSPYRLLVREGDAPPPGFDPVLSELEFSFKVGCPSDFDCRPGEPGPLPAPEGDGLDYGARDYRTFRRLMLDRLSVTLPSWTERNPADLGVTLVGMLAAVADEIAYAQDAAGTEAYLETARRRTSVRRHVRMLDYAVDEGAAARAFVTFRVDAGSPSDGQILPQGTVVLGSGDDPAFETLHDLELRAVRNRLRFHLWSDEPGAEEVRLLPAGATSATFVRPAALDLAPGDALILRQDRSPVTNLAGDADPELRHAVRVVRATPGNDPVEGVDVLEVEWGEEDALPFDLPLAARPDEDLLADLAVAEANVALAEHGRTLAVPLVPDRPAPEEPYRPRLVAPVAWTRAYTDPVEDEDVRAASAEFSGGTSTAAVWLTGPDGLWTSAADLLGAGPFDRVFVAEPEPGETTLRFGDDRQGLSPAPDVPLQALARLGGGAAGNVGRDALARVLWPLDGIAGVTNPLPARGGRDPESLARVRRFAPEAYRVQERAVTEDDLARRAEALPGVQAARARFRWTGSWHTAYVSVDRRGGVSAARDPRFVRRLLRHLDGLRMAGVDLEVRDPIEAAIHVVLEVCVEDAAFRSEVREGLADAFSERDFFSRDRFTFGEPVWASAILARAMEVPGVAHARLLRLERWGEAPDGELAQGVLTVGDEEIVRAASDPDRPESGRVEFVLEGGR